MSTTPLNQSRAAGLLTALGAYRPSRQAFLTELGLPASNRDPLAEFSEQFVAALTGGTLATSRVQAGHDLALVDDVKVQVRYLANPAGTWVNEHVVRSISGVHWYTLVLLEAFTVTGVLAFPSRSLAPICQALGKRHPRQNETLQLTRRNWWTIRDSPDQFRAHGCKSGYRRSRELVQSFRMATSARSAATARAGHRRRLGQLPATQAGRRR